MKQLAKLTANDGVVWYISHYSVTAIQERPSGGCWLYIMGGSTAICFKESATVIAERLEIPLVDRSAPIYGEATDILELSVRSRTILRRAHISTVGELTEKSYTDLLVLPGMGTLSLCEIREALGRHGLALRDEKVVVPPRA